MTELGCFFAGAGCLSGVTTASLHVERNCGFLCQEFERCLAPMCLSWMTIVFGAPYLKNQIGDYKKGLHFQKQSRQVANTVLPPHSLLFTPNTGCVCIYFIYLESSKLEGEKEISSIHWLTPLWTTSTGLVQSQKLLPGLLEVEQLGLELVLVWDAGTHYATVWWC